MTGDRRGGGEHDQRAGAWCAMRRRDGVPGSPPCLQAAARHRWAVAGSRMARRGGGEESGTSGGDEEVGSAAAKRAVRPDEAREDKL